MNADDWITLGKSRDSDTFDSDIQGKIYNTDVAVAGDKQSESCSVCVCV